MSREAVVNWAESQVGKGNLADYWTSALGKPSRAEPLSWCGIFSLAALHAAGLALDVFWKFGAGYLLQKPHPLRTVKTPEPADIGYIDQPYQHHFVVTRMENGMVHSVDGNSTGGKVTRQQRPLGKPGIVYYSIAPFLASAGLPPVSAPPKPRPPAELLQEALNALILRSPDASPPPLLKVDGLIGSRSLAALRWAQALLKLPQTGLADVATKKALGL